MHGGDAGAHQYRTDDQVAYPELGLAQDKKCNDRSDDRNDHRQQRDGQVKGNLYRQMERQHADEVHRPDAGPHRHRAGNQPYPEFPWLESLALTRPAMSSAVYEAMMATAMESATILRS